MASPARFRLYDPATVLRGPQTWSSYARFIRDPVAFLTDARRNHGKLFALGDPISLSNEKRKYVFALDSRYNEQILNDGERFRTSGIIWNGPIGSALHHMRFGLTRMNGVTHRRQRALLNPSMMRLAVNGHCEQMTINAVDLLEDWRPGVSLDLYQEMRRLSLRLTTLMLFCRDNIHDAERLSRTIRHFMQRSAAPATWLFPFNLPGTSYRKMVSTAEDIGKQLDKMIRRRYANPDRDGDVLDLLIEANRQQDAQFDLLGHAFVLFVGSYENIATTLTWTLFLLAQHPEVMEATYDELNTMLRGRHPTAAQLDKMPLLDAVLNESLRLLPPVTYLVRVATQPSELGSLDVREGDRVFCSPYITHRSRELYDQPDRFDPWRWFQHKPRPHEYLPFGAGPRVCIGRTFATTAIKMALALICQRWRVEVVPQARIQRGAQLFLMYPKFGVPVRLHHQDGQFASSPITGNVCDMIDFRPAERSAPRLRIAA